MAERQRGAQISGRRAVLIVRWRRTTAYSGRGSFMRCAQHPAVRCFGTLLKALGGPAAWTEICWREGVADRLTLRFARVRVRAAHRDYWLGEPRPEEWLLIEWPEGE